MAVDEQLFCWLSISAAFQYLLTYLFDPVNQRSSQIALAVGKGSYLVPRSGFVMVSMYAAVLSRHRNSSNSQEWFCCSKAKGMDFCLKFQGAFNCLRLLSLHYVCALVPDI